MVKVLVTHLENQLLICVFICHKYLEKYFDNMSALKFVYFKKPPAVKLNFSKKIVSFRLFCILDFYSNQTEV